MCLETLTEYKKVKFDYVLIIKLDTLFSPMFMNNMLFTLDCGSSLSTPPGEGRTDNMLRKVPAKLKMWEHNENLCINMSASYFYLSNYKPTIVFIITDIKNAHWISLETRRLF